MGVLFSAFPFISESAKSVKSVDDSEGLVVEAPSME